MNKFILCSLLVFAFLIRIINFNFPAFTVEEARLGARGYNLESSGKDELGRNLPFIFNSLSDYQLPVTSYLVAFGELIFGSNDFGARLPFILIGSLLTLLIYKITKQFINDEVVCLVAAFLTAISPTLVFLSKFPNQFLIELFLLTLFFYFLTRVKFNIYINSILLFLCDFTSKDFWITLPFFIFLVFVLNKDKQKLAKKKLIFLLFSLIFSLTLLVIFLNIPQGKRSLLENNLSLFSSDTIRNGINKLRGQGNDFGIPYILDRLLFNKTYFLIVGILNWLSSFSLSTYFGQFDSKGVFGFSQVGIWEKILLIPFFLGIFNLLKKYSNPEKLLLFSILVLTFPAIFIYPGISYSFFALTIPWSVIIIARGFKQMSYRWLFIICLISLIELTLNIFFNYPETKNADFIRPTWIRQIALDTFTFSKKSKIFISDNITDDLMPFIQWYNQSSLPSSSIVNFPYKFRETASGNIQILGSNQNLNPCYKYEKRQFILSKRDLLNSEPFSPQVKKIYYDSLGQEVAYQVTYICLN